MNQYRDLIIDLYKNPLNKRVIKNADITVSGANTTCGDHFRIYVKLMRGGKIKDISFEGEGCAISIAAVSLLTQEARGKTFKEISKWDDATVFKWLGTEIGPSRVKCGLLALEILKTAPWKGAV